MELLLSSGVLVLASGCLVGLGSLLAIVIIYFTIKNFFESNAKRREILLTGVTSPGIIVSAWNNYASGGGKHSRATTAHITFEIDVLPEGQPPFRAKIKETLPIKQDEWFMMGPRKEEVGKKVWVTYDPNNRNRIVLDHFDFNHGFMTRRRDFEKAENELQGVRKNGEDATAEILDVEDLGLSFDIEKDSSKILRLRLLVTPANSASYETDTVGLFMNTGLHKYTVGKKVYVKIDRADKRKVALNGAITGT